MIRRLAGRAILAVLVLTGAAQAAEVTRKVMSFSDLDGWAQDDQQKALDTFLITCPSLTDPDWRALCALADQHPPARTFFELFFRPVLIEEGGRALFTGYYETELQGALHPDARYRFPIYREPPEAVVNSPWLTRREIETSDVMKDRGLEIAWLDDPVDRFFLQIQGSGRIKLKNGGMLRVGYGGSNGQPYRSIGMELVRRGIYSAHQVSAQVIKNWVRRHPDEGRELLYHNPAYVFFRKVTAVPPESGPLGAMNRSVTPGRSLAVDPNFVPLGAPVWLEKDGDDPMRRLMVAQDTGSAIRGAQRADIFLGTGKRAGRLAGKLRDPGRMFVLLPIQRAYAMATEFSP